MQLIFHRAAVKARSGKSMPDTTTTKQRPLSPHVSIYRWPITMAMSIAHRISGVALYVGTLFVAAWLIAIACSSSSFDMVNGLFDSFIGRCVLFLYTLALVHHMVGGIRHLFWDTNTNLMEKHLASKTAWATVFITIIVSLLIWCVGYMVR